MKCDQGCKRLSYFEQQKKNAPLYELDMTVTFELRVSVNSFLVSWSYYRFAILLSSFFCHLSVNFKHKP
ncbi:hypothetical protein [uncultured Vibrio sp.]|uniref:hypothetical protein n=1 Tax=uncultured Vibrio sp. TaxID=114054 RepID=UPI0025DB5D0C|nr:hypothetical protein [uncultured Vibrio sp.]